MAENVSSTVNTMISLTRNVILLSSVAVAVLGVSLSKAIDLSALKYLALAIISISFWMGCVTVCWFALFMKRAKEIKAIRDHPSYDPVAWTQFTNILRVYMCVIVLATVLTLANGRK
jgi:ribose/xylose/arabinose/galactoside ABC-type transport system permease subunit